ncbi:MAG: hypothetical protein ABSE62_06235 [Chthoniobacteraceae bacterium]|jgi:tetratricopeptide (TPR) repeat protein
MGIFLRLLFLLAFLWLGFVLYNEAHEQAQLAQPDDMKVAMLFMGIILDGAVVALILALLVAPAIGDSIGSFFFNPSHEIEHDPHADAIAKLAQGNPEGAIEDYHQMLRSDPSDTLAISEIARICCRDLGDTARAASVLEHALASEWPHEQSSFLANRLADVYLLQSDFVRARQILVEIAQTLEGTRYAANALHRIHEVDRSIETGAKAPIYFEGVEEQTPSEDAPPTEEPEAQA